MDSHMVFQILSPLLQYFWYVIPLFLLVTVIKTSWFKGVLGEAIVSFLLKAFLSKPDYRIVNNVTLPTNDGTTQIDHIVVSRYGVFVVETKNMKGWIFGAPNQALWTQKIFKRSQQFQNPLYQNYKHLKTIQACLNLDSATLFSLVVFVGDAVFKTEMPDNVTYAFGALRFIKSKQDIVFSSEQVQVLVDAIESGRLARGFATHRAHVAHVNEIVETKHKQSCPQCGSALVMRQSQKGAYAGQSFWGCTAYPRCKFIRN